MDFIDFEATVASDQEVGSEDEFSDVDSLNSFTDDNTEIEYNRTCYCAFENTTKSVDETLAEEFNESMQEIDEMNEISHFRETSADGNEVDDFKDAEKRIEKFEETLYPSGDEKSENNSFVYAILLGLRFNVSDKIDVFDEKEIQETIEDQLFLKLLENRDRFQLEQLELDNRKFKLHCTEINETLADSSNFFRVFELRKQFGHPTLKKTPQKQKLVRQLSSCLTEKFNGFHIISVEYSKKLRKKFRPIDIIHKPVKKRNEKIKCYFSKDISRAFRNTRNKGNKISHSFAYQFITAVSFLDDQINIKDTWNIVLMFQELFIILIIKIL